MERRCAGAGALLWQGMIRALPMLGLLTMAAPVCAQNAAPTPDATSMADATPMADAAPGDIIVTALPPPPAAAAYGTEQVDGATLAATASGRIEEALARVPGFQQFRRSDSRSANPSSQGITLRGIGGNASSRTLLLLDGVPQADAFFGFIPFARFDADNIAAARITRGSGTGAFGAGAVAGTIELISRPLAERPPLAFDAAVGSRDSLQLGGAARVALGDGQAALTVRHDAGAGFYTTPLDQRVSASVPARYRSDMVELAASAPLSASTAIDARVAGFVDDRTLRFAGADSFAKGVDASLRLTARGRWSLEALGWVQARDFGNIVVSASSLRPTLNQRATPTTGWGGKLELRAPGPASRLLRMGIDVRGATGETIEDVLLASGARSLSRRAGGDSVTAGLFGEGDLLLGPLALTAGARIDHWRQSNGFLSEIRANGSVQTDNHYAAQSGSEISLRGAARWILADGLALRASAYTGFRAPSLNELYRNFTVFPVTTLANPALAPERLRGIDIGAEWTITPGATLTLTAFDDRLRGAISNVTIGTNLRQRRNIGAIEARGIEGRLAIEHGDWRLDAGWAHNDARVSIAADDATARPLDGLRPAQTPRDAASATLAWVRGTIRVQAGVRYTGAQYEDDRNVDRLPPASVIDAMISLPVVHGVSLTARAENIADVTVITRNVAGSIDLGAPRTLWLELRWAG